MLFYLVILQEGVRICSVSESHSTTNLLFFPFSLFCGCTHVHFSRKLGKDCSRSFITGVTSICSFVGYMKNRCFSFMSTYSFCCCSKNSYLNRICNNQCYNIQELRNLPNISHYSFVPAMGYKEQFEKTKVKTKNSIFQPSKTLTRGSPIENPSSRNKWQ